MTLFSDEYWKIPGNTLDNYVMFYNTFSWVISCSKGKHISAVNFTGFGEKTIEKIFGKFFLKLSFILGWRTLSIFTIAEPGMCQTLLVASQWVMQLLIISLLQESQIK